MDGAIDTTLATRGERYGSFINTARLAQGLKVVMAKGCNWAYLDADQRESLEMMATKIARILNGDADASDSWHDIAGYARLVEIRLISEEASSLAK